MYVSHYNNVIVVKRKTRGRPDAIHLLKSRHPQTSCACGQRDTSYRVTRSANIVRGASFVKPFT